MTWILLLLALAQPALSTLNVLNGKGSGQYPCGAKVKIEAPRHVATSVTGDDGVVRKADRDLVFVQWFSGWTGDLSIDRVSKNRATVTIPCREDGGATVFNIEARYQAQPPKK